MTNRHSIFVITSNYLGIDWYCCGKRPLAGAKVITLKDLRTENLLFGMIKGYEIIPHTFKRI